jgi:hypothetical protein
MFYSFYITKYSNSDLPTKNTKKFNFASKIKKLKLKGYFMKKAEINVQKLIFELPKYNEITLQNKEFIKKILDMPIEFRFSHADNPIRDKLRNLYNDFSQSISKLPENDWDFIIVAIARFEISIILNKFKYDTQCFYKELLNLIEEDIVYVKEQLKEIEVLKNQVVIINNYTKGLIN